MTKENKKNNHSKNFNKNNGGELVEKTCIGK